MFCDIATLLMVVSVVLVSDVASLFFPSGNAGVTDSNDEDEDFIDQGLACNIFDRLFLEMRAVVVQLTQQVQQIQTSDQHIAAGQLGKLLTAEFAQVFEDHNVDAD